MVFWASAATLLTTFGVVPFQAGMFTIEKVTKTSEQTFVISNNFLPAADQNYAATIKAAQSVYGILTLNETMPGFMTSNYTLAPFTAASEVAGGSAGLWIANTTLFSMDVNCQPIEPWFGESEPTSNSEGELVTYTMAWFNITADCELSFDANDIYNDTIGTTSDEVAVQRNMTRTKAYTTFFSAYYDSNNYDSFGFDMPCFEKLNGTFFAASIHNKIRPEDPPNSLSAVTCKPFFHEHPVQATVDMETERPISVVSLGEKQQISLDMLNTTAFLQTLAAGVANFNLIASGSDASKMSGRKNGLPSTEMPGYLDAILKIDVTPVAKWKQAQQIHPLSAMAMTMSNYSLEDFNDPAILGEAYQTVYRLLFVRVMNDLLEPDFVNGTTESVGRRLERLEAVKLEPVFTYIVEILLGLVSVSMIALCYHTATSAKGSNLVDDPGRHSLILQSHLANE